MREEKAALLVLILEDSAAPVDELAALASSVHFALTAQLNKHELRGLLDEAREIQTCLLPSGPLEFGGYDVAAISIPAQQEVGGDLYEFLPLDEEACAIAIADASGHGLPAALQARDVTTGLRMGARQNLKIPHLVGSLNRVIHQGGMTSRFVSLFYAELESNGNLFYVNAGHPPPLILDDGGFSDLQVGGMVLGPYAEASYKLGFAHLDRGGLLVLYTDGVVERVDSRDEEFGMDGLKAWATEARDMPSGEAADLLRRRIQDFGEDTPFEDDVTFMIIRRPRS